MAFSGQTTVTTAGTEVVLGTQKVGGPLMIKALPGNTGIMYIGNNGSGAVSSTTGMALDAGEVLVLEFVGALSQLMVDSSVNGESVAWLMLVL